MIHAIDTETTGLKHAWGDKAFLIAYTNADRVPCTASPLLESTKHIAEMLVDDSNEWVGHNIGFDLPFLADYMLIPSGNIHDMMIAAHIYNNLEPFKDLASLATKYCNIPNTEDQKLDQWFVDHGYNKDNRNYADVPLDIMIPYAKADVRRTLALYDFYKEKGVLEDPAYLLEMKLVPIVAKIAARGMCVDTELAQSEFTSAVKLLADIETKAKQDYEVENIASTHQIADALFTRGGLTCTTFTVKKNICLDETAIQKYDHPLVDMVLKHRQVSKLTNTYLTAIIEKSRNGRLYSSLKQVGARTGRFSSSDPNLQNIPRYDEECPINLRKCFVCSPGNSMLLVDLSQIELRILAHYSQEPSMIETLQDRKGDIHTTTAIAMFGEVNSELRTVAKTLNFAVIYGAGGNALVEQINKALPNKRISFGQAKDFKAKFFKGYPRVQQFLWDVQRRISERGYVSGKSGRKYYCDKTKAYVASNYLIQGESAMLMKTMMIDIEGYLSTTSSRLINVIHDEFIIDLYTSDELLIPEILTVIEQPEGWRVPIYANAAITHTSWADKNKVL